MEIKTLTLNGKKYDSFIDKNGRENMRPLLLDADMAESYDTDPQYGDVALEALIMGKPILIKTPNASGDAYNANYSPVYMYQVPDTGSNYLYLFYLRDEKQEIDLSAIGLGVIKMPIYSQLQMKLSKEYTDNPLES